MAQIAPIQPNLSSAPPPGGSPPAGGEQQAFSPHLQKALNDRTGHNSPDKSPNTRSQNTDADQKGHSADGESATEPVTGQLDHYPLNQYPPLPGENDNGDYLTLPASGIAVSGEPAQLFTFKHSPFSQASNSALWSQASNSALWSQATNGLATPGLSATSALEPMPQAGVSPQVIDTDAMFRFTDARAGQFPAKQANLAIAVGSEGQPMTGGEGKSANHRDSLLGQLQQIIANSRETGRVAITASQQSPANHAASVSPSLTSAAQVAGLNSGEIPPLGTTTENPVQQLPGLRQNIHQQYYQAKMSQFPGQDAGAEEQQAQNEPGRQTASLTAATALASPATVADSGTTFHQTLMTGQEPAPLLASEPGRAIPLPGATQVHDQQVMRQVIERFQLNKRPLETHINIRLQPAELGALKIDLTVSEGSIRASVVAQNQQVQEIIERNLARLRSILEGQGFTIDSLVVTSESETIDEFNHFDSRPFQHGAVPGELKASGKPAASTVDFDQLVAVDIQENRVVNLKI
jgi:hypothetical protein